MQNDDEQIVKKTRSIIPTVSKTGWVFVGEDVNSEEEKFWIVTNMHFGRRTF